MQTETNQKAKGHAEVMLGELEVLRGEARKLQGEARLKADQHANKLADQIEKLEVQSRIAGNEADQRASGAVDALKKAWVDLGETIKRSTHDIKRELDGRK